MKIYFQLKVPNPFRIFRLLMELIQMENCGNKIMDPNQVLAYMFSAMNSYIPPMYPTAWPSVPIEPMSVPKVLSPLKKYHRTWKKNQVEEIFNISTKYCQTHNKNIEDLSLRDFEIIAKNCEQTSEQVMNKINEINRSGTLRPGIWCGPEDELLKSLLKKGLEK